MSLTSRAIERVMRLPPAVTRAVRVHRDLETRTRDGVVLRADHYQPELPDAPTILLRTPYGRGGLIGVLQGRVFAERGFHVVIQSCRGTFDSGGAFEPMRHEHDDGLDTLTWLRAQPWYDGRLFTHGASYLGFTQWALAAGAAPDLRGMVLPVTTAAFRDPTYAGGAYSLDTTLNWAALTANMGGSLASFLVRQRRTARRITRVFEHLPLGELDTLLSGAEVAFFQEWLRHDAADDPYWQPRNHRAEVTAPILMIAGWQDIFLPWQLADFQTLRAAGAHPRLVIGDWTHADRELLAYTCRAALRFFTTLAAGDPPPTGVRVQIAGAGSGSVPAARGGRRGRKDGGGRRGRKDGGGRRDLPDWPPHQGAQPWYLQAGRGLSPVKPDEAGVQRFHYDPADPTPSPAGPLLTPLGGRVDNAAVERRPDMLVYTGARLTAPVEAIGPASATLYVRASVEHFDVAVRVCDVDPQGRSWNVCDGLRRIRPGDAAPDADGVRAVEVPLWPIGYRWAAGHRIRVQVAAAAWPRYARNTGTGEPLHSAVTLCPSDHEVHHGPEHPSAVVLPVAPD